MHTIRKILLTEYIGAILVGVLIADALSALITGAIGRVWYYVQLRSDPMLHRGFSTTYAILDTLLKFALFLIVAYVVARWLYPDKAEKSSQA